MSKNNFQRIYGFEYVLYMRSGTFSFLLCDLNTNSLRFQMFEDFEETFRSECRERKAEAGVPSGVAAAEDEANVATEMSEENVSRNHQII